MRVVVVGEGMLELTRDGAQWRLAHGGDTLNTAIHLARFGRNVAFVTALGCDPFSDVLRAAWSAEGVDTSLILTDDNRGPGLYAITTEAGERSFTYWRGDSAARRVFELPGIDDVVAAAESADLLVFSLISIAVLPPEGRAALFGLCRRVRARGGKVAFDGNYRPRLWAGAEEAKAARDEALALTDIGLPTLEDEAALSGERDAAAVHIHWRGRGVGEVAVKLGGEGCLLQGQRLVAPPTLLAPIDTSGAGDAFNAGYLDARLSGADQENAARAGHRLASWVVMRPGAIPTVDPDAPYGDR